MITNEVLIIACGYKVTTCNRCAKHELDSLPTLFQKTCFEHHNTGYIIVMSAVYVENVTLKLLVENYSIQVKIIFLL